MAEHTIDRFVYNGDTYKLHDSISGYATAAEIPGIVEYTDQEIATLILETPSGITPLANASGVSF